jgi:predicted dehydrogenase
LANVNNEYSSLIKQQLSAGLDTNVKILICGLGAIGERHLGNLLTLGYTDISLMRTMNKPFRTIKGEFPTFSDLDVALRDKPDVVFVCNPTSLHVETITKALAAGCHVFTEKPLATTIEECDAIQASIQRSGKSVMVGYNMRFHPALITVKDWIDSGRIGTPIYTRTQWGEYLPNWHPWEDYRVGYAARSDLGGGPALTLSHEIDLLLWVFGKHTTVKAHVNTSSSLELQTEHGIDILLGFESGATGNVHLDYFHQPPARSSEFIGEGGRIEFEYYSGIAKIYGTKNSNPVKIFETPSEWDRNDMFIDELKSFFYSIESGTRLSPSFDDGLAVVDVVSKALFDAGIKQN